MRYSLLILLVLLALAESPAGNNEEFRAVWVITWEHISSGNTAEENKARVREILENIKKANMNAVLWQVRQSGTAYYNSSYEPWGYYAGYQDPGYDPLAYAIEQAHLRGIELHAWFNAFAVAEDDAGLDPQPPAVIHPDWVCRNGSGQAMPRHMAFSPGLSAVRDYTIDVAMEIVNNYDIDGLHLDYVRWNEYTTSTVLTKAASKREEISRLDGIAPEGDPNDLVEWAIDRYLWDAEHPYNGEIPEGFSDWEDWWRYSVTEFVKTLHDSIQAVKPWVRLSPAALGNYNWSSWNGYNAVYQDAALWFNQGYIDQLTPMHYHWLDADGFYGMLEGDCPACWSQNIQEGITAGRLFTVGPGSYRFEEEGVWDNHPSVINRCRELTWTDGFQFFSYGSWRDQNYWDEAKELIFRGKAKIRSASYMIDHTPQAPVVTLIKNSPLTYEIAVTPPLSIDRNQWFAVYRSEDEMLDVTKDEIIDIHFGQDTYSYVDVSDGLQDFNGRYSYYATMLDRVWNESANSNFEVSDSIPSFAPQVLNSLPAAGDTVDVNRPLVFTFSKTMDINTIQNLVTLVPSAEISQFIWSVDSKVLTLTFGMNLAYKTDYLLTIKKDVTDINGRQLDGNGDGIAGDDFLLNFTTKEYDETGPRVIYNHPHASPMNITFDVADILTLAFDEIVDHGTVDENSVYLLSDGNSVSSKSLVFDIGQSYSVIALQPLIPLNPAHTYAVYYENNITDTLANPIDSTIQYNFQTEPFIYQSTILIDDFTISGYWWDPNGSGSTSGVSVESIFQSGSSEAYLPAATKPLQKKSGKLYYAWDPEASDYLLREFLDYSAPPKSVQFDTSNTLQCYIFGDGSGNRFRFSLSEVSGVGYPLEVSKWIDIDWIGWKLISWKLSDTQSVGSWLGNEVLDGTAYYMDSFQLTHQAGAALSGILYFKDLRVIKKVYDTVGAVEGGPILPLAYALEQNYPNPFNAQTTIKFSIAGNGLTRLIIYDILGRNIASLVNEHLNRGQFAVSFDASHLASGVYIYELRSADQVFRKKMMLVK
jgi:uncharacterized lipoprotein YddW (UPF0748 family)